MKKLFFFKASAIVLALVFILSGCSLFGKKQDDQPPLIKKTPIEHPSENPPVSIEEQLAAQSNIRKFTNYEDLQEFLEQGDDSYDDYYMSEVESDFSSVSPGGIDVGMDFAGEIGFSEKSAVSDDFSTTNVQVEGVDEADIIKTDGKYVYAVVKNNLFIIDARPAENSTIVSKIEFESRPQNIYINGEDGKTSDRLVIFGQNSMIHKNTSYQRYSRRPAYTFFKIFDISDKKNPKQLKNYDFEGSYNNSRMIGDYVYFITGNHNYYWVESEPILPRILDNGQEIALYCSTDAAEIDCVMPNIYYFDVPYSSYNFTAINAINIKNTDKKINQEIYIMSGSQNMYVSQNNIYITYTKHISEYQLEMEIRKELIFPGLSEKDQNKIYNIERAANYILSPNEKRGKIEQILERFSYSLTDEEQNDLENKSEEAMKRKYQDISKELEKTVIHKINIDKDLVEYQTNGEVTGYVLNQFSMDEANGYFRIATTRNRTWSRYQEERMDSYSNVYVLDHNLNQVGAVEGLAEGERIYSARFMQNRAYLVTFKDIDPLFVIDLSNPKNPKVLGELKIPGYSDYLHPYDDTTLIGLGKDVGESEWGGVRVKGLKLSLFDVSDVSKPREVDTYIMGDSGSESIALRDHKAFLFSRDKNLLVIPVSIRESLDGNRWGSITFSGAAVVNVDKNGFSLRGRIDHSDGGQPAKNDYWRGYSYYDNSVLRSLYIDNVLYTFSNNYLAMNELSELKSVKKLKLEKTASQKDDGFIIIN